MELEKARIELKQIGNTLSLKTNRVECYLFGSILSNPKHANDIDVLIIYKNEKQIHIIKQEFNVLKYTFPLHMNYFTFEEEAEFNFASEQKAEIIFKI